MHQDAWSLDADIKNQAAAWFPCTQLDNKITGRLPDSFRRNLVPIIDPNGSAMQTIVIRGLYGKPYILHQMPMAVANVAEASKT